jgi:hypothetical protein
VPVEVRGREERERRIGQDGFLLQLRFDPEDDHIGVSLAGVRVDRVRARVAKEEEAAATHLVDRRAGLAPPHARQRTRDLVDVIHGRRTGAIGRD